MPNLVKLQTVAFKAAHFLIQQASGSKPVTRFLKSPPTMVAKKKKSTTRSDTSLESLSDYVFFLDRALQSYSLRYAPIALGARVEMHGDYFADNAADVDWLPEVASKGWIILTKKSVQLAGTTSNSQCGRAGFLLIPGGLPGSDQVRIICAALRRMLRLLKVTSPPFVARIYRSSEVKIIPNKPPRS